MLIKPDNTVSASVLAGVLVVCTLILISILLVMSLWDSDLLLHSRFYYREQQQANLVSAFVLYEQDSTLIDVLRQDSSVLLFPEEDSSRVHYRVERWGLYEAVEVSCGGRRWKSARLLGKKFESDRRTILYVPDNRKALSLSGNSFLDGKVCLSANGITYTQVRSEFFRGMAVLPENISLSTSGFPGFDRETFVVTRELFNPSWEVLEYDGQPVERSFSEPVCRLWSGDKISGCCLRGHIILYANDWISINCNNDLQQIIVVARSVEIEKGFRGSLQVFARDSILVGDQVCLGAGSGLWVEGEHPERLIRLGENCEVNGYIVVNGCPVVGKKHLAHYYQPWKSKVRGLVYVDGVADVHGIINGSLYMREACYFAREGYYSGLLYGLTILRNPEIAYPFLMSGPYVRKEVRWID